MSGPPQQSDCADRWFLDPDVVFLNHGSFGATPRVVLDAQTRIRERLEREPLQFFDHQYLDELERFLLDLVRPRTFDDFESIDRLIAEAEGDA